MRPRPDIRQFSGEGRILPTLPKSKVQPTPRPFQTLAKLVRLFEAQWQSRHLPDWDMLAMLGTDQEAICLLR